MVVHPDCYLVLGVRVDAVQIDDAIATLETWIAERRGCRYVAVTGMHGISEARRDPGFRAALNEAGLVVADGMPLVWLGRLRGKKNMRRRVYGPELMIEFCRRTAPRGYRHFFYGGKPGVAEELAAHLRQRCPGLNIVGTYTPPFRALTAEEQRAFAAVLQRSAPDVLWVGLSTPKQERWMQEASRRLDVPVLLGVGAAFDILSGRSRQAPRWMREHGLEWLFRLGQEPRRLWRRYLLHGPVFVASVLIEELRLRFAASRTPSK